jgi:hypothetical protein
MTGVLKLSETQQKLIFISTIILFNRFLVYYFTNYELKTKYLAQSIAIVLHSVVQY